jgi:hypothetical protein
LGERWSHYFRSIRPGATQKNKKDPAILIDAFALSFTVNKAQESHDNYCQIGVRLPAGGGAGLPAGLRPGP